MFTNKQINNSYSLFALITNRMNGESIMKYINTYIIIYFIINSESRQFRAIFSDPFIRRSTLTVTISDISSKNKLDLDAQLRHNAEIKMFNYIINKTTIKLFFIQKLHFIPALRTKRRVSAEQRNKSGL